jgi:hypothetical protein
VTGPYRCEIVEDVHQPVLKASPKRMTRLLFEHLSEHAHRRAGNGANSGTRQ